MTFAENQYDPLDVRTWPYYVITLPLLRGEGPVSEQECDEITYAVWDQFCNSHGSYKYLPDAIKKLYNEKTDRDTHEGYVVRLADSFEYRNFKTSVAKYVRANHVATTKHWMYGAGKQHETNGVKE